MENKFCARECPDCGSEEVFWKDPYHDGYAEAIVYEGECCECGAQFRELYDDQTKRYQWTECWYRDEPIYDEADDYLEERHPVYLGQRYNNDTVKFMDASHYPDFVVGQLQNDTQFAIASKSVAASLDSTAIETALYMFDESKMVLVFHGQERVYDYLDVPYSEYWKLISGESAGRYFNKEMRGRYDYFVLDPNNDEQPVRLVKKAA